MDQVPKATGEWGEKKYLGQLLLQQEAVQLFLDAVHKVILRRGEEDAIQAKEGQGDGWESLWGRRPEGQDQSTDSAPPNPQCRRRKGLEASWSRSLLQKERNRLRGGEGTCPDLLAQQQLGTGGVPPRWSTLSPHANPMLRGPLCPGCARSPQAHWL